jgi:hypothetical protein
MAKRKPSSELPKLHPASFDKFVQSLQKDEKLKAKAIEEIHRYGFRAFIQQHFGLISRQKRELDTMKEPDVERVANDALITVLMRGGKIELIHEGHEPPNLAMEFYGTFKDGKIEVGVRIKC